MRIAILAPIQNSLYSRLVTHLAASEPGITVSAVLVRTPWTWRRIRGELKRDGARLLRKAYRKLILGERGFDAECSDHLLGLARGVGLPGRTIRDVCSYHSIPMATVSDHNSARSIELLRQANADVVAFTGGGLLRKDVLEAPRLGVLNCHMGPLPEYRGMDVVEYPVIEERLEDLGIGLTVHFMDRGVDTGPILFSQPAELHPGDTFPTVRRRMERQMVEAMLHTIRGVRDGLLLPQPQQKADGRQYFVMHPRIQQLAEARLKHALDHSFAAARRRSIRKAG